jgi:hypothetical protein
MDTTSSRSQGRSGYATPPVCGASGTRSPEEEAAYLCHLSTEVTRQLREARRDALQRREQRDVASARARRLPVARRLFGGEDQQRKAGEVYGHAPY